VRGVDPKLLRISSAGLGFGAMVALSVWLAWKLGEWLDARMGTRPLWTSLLVLLAIVGSFIELIRQIRQRS